MNVVIVGGGVMGEAILGAALEGGVFLPGDVTVIEKLQSRREQLLRDYSDEVSGGY